jgi:hypothetical protein
MLEVGSNLTELPLGRRVSDMGIGYAAAEVLGTFVGIDVSVLTSLG